MKTPDISHELFGGVLVADGAGHYPGLELLNLIYGCQSGILPDEEAPRYIRTSHDFARRLVWDSENFANNLAKSAFLGDDATTTLAYLFGSLQLNVPDRGSKNWEAAHFFPYTRSLVHWDARNSRRVRQGESARAQIERRYLRGGGALAHKVLRQDSDRDRLELIRIGFGSLMPESHSTALDTLAAALATHGQLPDPVTDDIEQRAEPRNDTLDDHYRNGIKSILSHSGLSSTSRVKATINWTGFWLAICQADRSASRLGDQAPKVVVDCGSGPSQLRRESSRALKDITAQLGGAAQDCLSDGVELKSKSRQDIVGFFTRTCAWIGLLNSFKGRRHFVVKLDLLEALVMAHVPAGTERSFEDFIATLCSNYGLVIGRDAAARSNLLTYLDASVFEDNEEAFASQLYAAGLVHAYSDATRMVGTRTLV